MHLVYKVTNNINGKYYIGVQNTDAQDYLGSGKAITNAIHKYGKENFTKEILATCNTKEETFLIESMIVTEDLVNDPNCYNMKLGGNGGSMKGTSRPPRDSKYRTKQSISKKGINNPRHLGTWVTPWGEYQSLNDASNACPSKMSGIAIGNACRKNNNKIINNLSVARSKGFLKSEHVGKTYSQIGFKYVTAK
jgi:hypothetical protein